MQSQLIDYMKFKTNASLIVDVPAKRTGGNFKYRRDSDYGIVRWGHNKSDMFSHELKGSHIQTWRDDGLSDFSLLENILDAGGIFTRLDLAVTVQGDHMEDLLENIEKFQGALADQRVVKYIADPLNNNVETIYIGDRKDRAKKGVFRAYRYDLAHGGDDMLTRFELEIGSRSANSAAKRVDRVGDIGSVVRGYIDCSEWDVWIDAMGEGVEISVRGESARKQKSDATASREKWLLEQVAPSLGKHMAECDLEGYTNVFLNKFLEQVTIAHDKHMAENFSLLKK